MLNQQTLDEALNRILSVASPSKVILFGSHARGDADAYSDLDLLVVEPQVENQGAEMMRLHKVLWPLNIAVDLLVCSEAEFEKKREWCSSAIYWAAREGKVLYGAL